MLLERVLKPHGSCAHPLCGKKVEKKIKDYTIFSPLNVKWERKRARYNLYPFIYLPTTYKN